MTIREQIKEIIKNAVSSYVSSDGTSADKDFTVEVPENKNYGDYATNAVLILAKKQGKNLKEVADKLVSEFDIRNSKFLDKVEVLNGFINFFLKSEFLQCQVKEILKQERKFGQSKIGKSKTIIIDYSAPNIAKKMHVGHLRSTIIGGALYNIFKFLGYKAIGDNHIGDWGKQFGIMIAACKRYGLQISDLEKITTSEMLDIYVKFNKEIKENTELEDLAREEFKKLECGGKENRKIWEILRKRSLDDFDKIYNILGIKFELVLGESFYENKMKEIIKDALGQKIAIKNPDNSVVIPLAKFNLTDCLILKSDGATLYETRDLATIKYRVKKYNPDIILYVVGNEQTLHFQQLFQSAELLGYISKDKLHHIKFGLILDENHKKLATREGRFIGADDLINQIIELAEKATKEKNPSLSEKARKEAAKIIGIGTLKYNDLSQNRQSDIVFDWDKMLSFEGNSAPYILYTYVRLQSILRKTKFAGSFEPKFLKEKEEIDIIKELDEFPDIVEESAKNFQTNNLADYLYRLASSANGFYEKYPVLKTDHDIRSARLALIKAITIVLKNGLNLLGIETLERM